MNNKVIMTESQLNKFVGECVRRCLNELQTPQNMPQQQVNHSNTMQAAVDNGGRPQGADDYLAQQDTYYGKIAQLAQQSSTTYTQIISDLQKKITYYLNAGYFGNNQEVLQTIKLFTELLSFLHGSYEAAASKAFNGRGSMQEGALDGLVYKKQNQYGVQQHVNDKSGNQYAVQNQKNGQWMTDLQNELQQMMKWNFLHGPKTIQATKLFIDFLNVEKRAFFMWFDNNSKKILNGLKAALVGVTLLLSVGGGLPNGGYNNNQQPNNMPSVEMQAPQQQQSMQVQFNKNSAEISPEMAQQISQLPQGNYKIIVHELQNPSGVDASYENNLVQQRGTAIQNLLKGSNVTIERGENVSGTMASCEIAPM